MEFSRPYYSSFYAVVIPLETKSKIWYIVEPYHYNVWTLLIATVPIYIIVMSLTDYFYCGLMDWKSVGGFVIRNVLSEHNFKLQYRARIYQKILDVIWISSMLIMVQAYSGNLTAMLAKPKLHKPIQTLEELINQGEISWALTKGSSFEFYIKGWPNGTVIKSLYNKALIVPQLTLEEQAEYGSCYANKFEKEGKFGTGSICSVGEILPMFHADVTETGKCNFYLMEEKIFESLFSMAFQVRINVVI